MAPKCAKVDVNSLANWCDNNQLGEDYAHAVRKLVDNSALFSTIYSMAPFAGAE